MISDIIIDYPWWLFLLVILTGLLYAGTLYIKNTKSKIGLGWTVFLFIFRFLATSILAFLLLSPFIQTKVKTVEKPTVVIGIDNSRSMLLAKDSGFIKTEFEQQLTILKEQLSEKYQVDTYLFGNSVEMDKGPSFSDEISNYSSFIGQVGEDYQGTNIGALIIAGDGIYNRGIDPVFAASPVRFSIYTVALGDTSLNKDLKINDTRYNSIVYFGDDFPLEVNVSADKLDGNKATLKLYAFGRLQETKKIDITGERFNKSYRFILNAESSGKQRLRLELETDATETNTGNNTKNIFLDILDNRQKILILANAPHPDVSAIKQSLELNKNFEIEVQYPQRFNGMIEGFDLIILHQLPSLKQPMTRLFNKIEKDKIPSLFIIGKQSNFISFDKQFKGIDLRTAGRNFEEAQLDLNPSFSLFIYPNELKEQLSYLPPLIVPMGNYRVAENASVFAYQKIRNISTDFPLITFYNDDETRNGLIAGEGLWMWRIHNYLTSNNTDAFDIFVQKTVQLLMARKDKRFFRVNTKGIYRNTDRIAISAELYTKSYEPTNNADVSFTLFNESGENFNYIFSPDGKAYSLDLNRLPIGVYKYSANTKLGQDQYNTSGEFVVTGESLEGSKLNANHRMLYKLAADHNGQLLFADEMMDLPEIMLAGNNMKSKIYYEEKYTGLHNLPYVIGLLLLLLSIEWFLRKYLGGY